MRTKDNVLVGEAIADTIMLPKNLTLGELMLNQLKNHGTQIAQISSVTRKERTYKEVLDLSLRLAVYLREKGFQVDDRVSICSENHVNYCIVLFATLFLGGATCPLNPRYTKRELQHALHVLKPKYIFVSPVAVQNLREVVKELDWSPVLISLYDRADNLPDLMDIIAEVPSRKAAEFVPPRVNPNDHVVAILCSSGTTGLPKGVMLTDRNILAILQNVINSQSGFRADNVTTLDFLPYFHAYAFILLHINCLAGMKAVVLPSFEEELFLRMIEKYRIEQLTLVPPLMVFLAKHPIVDRFDLSSLKTIWCGAAPLSEEIQEAVKRRLNVSMVSQAYGLTETTLSVLRPRLGVNKPGSVGQVVPGISAKVIPAGEDKTKGNLGPNCVGELCFKGDLIMKGYCGDVSSTAAIIDKDGWLHTGDLGYYDEDGFFYIVDRLKELIKYKGFQVPPAELESILLTHPGVKDAAVIGIPDEAAGELPLAFVVKQPRARLNEKDIVKYVNDRVSSQKRLRGGVRFVDEIPKTPSGKLLRRNLRDSLKSKL